MVIKRHPLTLGQGPLPLLVYKQSPVFTTIPMVLNSSFPQITNTQTHTIHSHTDHSEHVRSKPQRHLQFHMPTAELLTALLPGYCLGEWLCSSSCTKNSTEKSQRHLTCSPNPNPSSSPVSSASKLLMCQDKLFFLFIFSTIEM